MEHTTETATEPRTALAAVTVRRKSLLAALARATVATNGRKAILRAVQLRVADDGLHVTACNGEMTSEEIIPIPEGELGTLAPIDAKHFAHAVEGQHGDGVTIAAESGLRVSVNGSLTVQGFDPADFPPPPTASVEVFIQLDAHEFVQAGSAALHHAATEPTRYGIDGVLIERDEAGAARMVATDGRRLLVYPLTTAQGTREGAFIVWRPYLAAAVKAAKTALTQPVLISTSPFLDPESKSRKTIRIRVGHAWQCDCMEVEWPFPKYAEVIPPRMQEDAWIVGRELLRDAISKAALVCCANEPAATLRFNETCQVSAGTAARSANLAVPCHYAGEQRGVDMVTGVNPHYMLDALDAFDTADLRIQSFDPNRPLRIEAPEVDGPLVILMCVAVDWPDGMVPIPSHIATRLPHTCMNTPDEFTALDWVQAEYRESMKDLEPAVMQLHRTAVEAAVRAGRAVPAHVLAHYPDLAGQPASASDPTATGGAAPEAVTPHAGTSGETPQPESGSLATAATSASEAPKGDAPQTSDEKPPEPTSLADAVTIPITGLKWGRIRKASKKATRCACCGEPIAKGEEVQFAWVAVYRHARHGT